MIHPSWFLALSLLLFVMGIIAFFVKRDLLTQFLSVEIMLNAANLAFLALAQGPAKAEAQVIVFFVMTVAAAEAAVCLAILVTFFRNRGDIAVDDAWVMKG